MNINIDLNKDLKPLFEAIERMEKKLDNIAPLMKGDILDDHDLKEIFKVSQRTIYDWRRDGRINFIKVGKATFYTKDQVWTFINKHKRNSEYYF